LSITLGHKYFRYAEIEARLVATDPPDYIKVSIRRGDKVEAE
jgi:hypothetical protein